MNISILGAGNVGVALARALLRAGQPVTMGVPEPARYADAVAALAPLAMAWIHLAFNQGQGRRFAFARMTRA